MNRSVGTQRPQNVRGGVNINIKNQKKKKKKSRGLIGRFFSFLFVMAFFVVIMYLAARLFFRVGKIEAEGLLSYSESEIIALSGISEGSFMYSIDKSKAEKSILEKCPYIGSVKIDRRLPATVVISVTEEKTAFYITYDNENILLSESMRVLEITKEKPERVAFAYFPEIHRAIEAGRAQFVSSAANTGYIDVFVSALSKQLETGAITELDARDKYNLTAVFEGRYTVKFGNTDELTNKINVALEIIAAREVAEAKGAVIDVKDPSESGVTLIYS